MIEGGTGSECDHTDETSTTETAICVVNIEGVQIKRSFVSELKAESLSVSGLSGDPVSAVER